MIPLSCSSQLLCGQRIYYNNSFNQLLLVGFGSEMNSLMEDLIGELESETTLKDAQDIAAHARRAGESQVKMLPDIHTLVGS